MGIMHQNFDASTDLEQVVPKEPYLSREFARGELEKLWPKVWLMACREEEVAKPGRYVTFEIGDESIIVVRDGEGVLRAFHNVCQHRGRRLVNGCGAAAKLFCRYHGWRWNLDGNIDVVIDREDWAGTLSDDRIRLKDVKLGTWGGFVFINMDPNAEPLEQYLAPFIHAFRNYKLDTMRYAWMKSVKLPCNWKVAIDVFIEGYHAQTAHRQSNSIINSRYACEIFGPHSVFRERFMPEIGIANPNFQYIGGIPDDNERFLSAKGAPAQINAFFETLYNDLNCMVTPRFMRASKRMLADLPAETPLFEALGVLDAYHREEGRKEEVEWDDLTMEDMGYLGMDWSMFPNIAMLPTADGVLYYRARPIGDDPDSCWFDIYSIERFAPGQEPKVEREVYQRWEDGNWPRIFIQDFENLADIQQGMKSRGYEAGLPNPLSEACVTNLHREVRRRVLGAND